MANIFERTHIGDLVSNKGFLICAPKNATVQQILETMAENEITAIPIASETSNHISIHDIPLLQGSPNFIGIISMFDIVLHIANNINSCQSALQIPVSNIIGQTIESKALWTVGQHVKLIDAMGFLSKGVHRFLVPNDGGTQFRLLTQSDVVRFMVQHMDEMGPFVTRTVMDLGLIHPSMGAMAVPSSMKVSSALNMMRQKPAFGSLAVVESEDDDRQHEHSDIDHYGCCVVSGGKLVGSLSATYFRGMGVDEIGALRPGMTVLELLERSSASARPVVTARPTTPMGTIMAMATDNKVHRVWVTDEENWLMGVVSFSDIINCARRDPQSFMQRQ